MPPQRKGHPTPEAVKVHKLRTAASEDSTDHLLLGRAHSCKPGMLDPDAFQSFQPGRCQSPGTQLLRAACLPLSHLHPRSCRCSLTLNPCDCHIFLTKYII